MTECKCSGRLPDPIELFWPAILRIRRNIDVIDSMIHSVPREHHWATSRPVNKTVSPVKTFASMMLVLPVGASQCSKSVHGMRHVRSWSSILLTSRPRFTQRSRRMASPSASDSIAIVASSTGSRDGNCLSDALVPLGEFIGNGILGSSREGRFGDPCRIATGKRPR
jgi:hypothetical protein